MAEEMTRLPLAAEFPPATRDDWLALAGDLDRLRSSTYDEITIEPLYTAADAPGDGGVPGFAPFVRGRTAAGHRDGWDVRQSVDATQGTGAAVAELERGATSVWLRLRDAPEVDEGHLDAVLDGVMLDVAPVVLDAGPRWLAAATAFAHLCAHHEVDPAAVAGSIGADPFGEWAIVGDPALDDELRVLADEARVLAARHPGVRVATIDGTRYHDLGASDGQELAWTLAAAVATLRALTVGGLDIATALGQLELRLAATVDQFATIAKYRAARRVVARVAEACGAAGAAGDVPLHAVTSSAMAARYDAATNMLRHTVACFAAGVAGADAVTVLPHDDLLGASGLGRRIARNTQTVLAMESHLARVIDPAGGSWYVEALTTELATAAWTQFQQIETAGGFRAAVDAGLLDEQLAATRARRDDDIDHRRLPIVGVSESPDVTESLPPPRGDDHGVHRWAARFEVLRRRADAAADAGERPRVFLATVGAPAAFTARSTFATNFFATAGIATERGPVTSDAAEITAAFSASGAAVACLCSDDTTYAREGAAVAAALTAAGAQRVYVAGRPRDALDALTAAGVTHTITAHSDARAELADLLDALVVHR